MNRQTEKRLQSKLNKNLIYGKRIINITGYEVRNDRVFLEIDRVAGAIDRPTSDVDAFLNMLQEVKSEDMEVTVANTHKQVSNITEDVETFKDIIKENIRKIQEDAKYAQTANAINKQINSYVNVTKMQLDILKTIKDLNE